MIASRTSQVVRPLPVLCEPLEGRQLLSAGGSATLSPQGILTLEGTRHDDTIRVVQYAGKQGKPRVRASFNGHEVATFLARSVRGVRMIGGLGNDTLEVEPTASPKADQATLNLVDDAATPTGWHAVELTATPGTWGVTEVTLTPFPIPVTLSGGGGRDQLIGGGADDVLEGGGGDDVLNGQGGDDQLFGRDGDDSLRGGDGTDALFGGAGDDDLDGSGTRAISGSIANADGSVTYTFGSVTTPDPEADRLLGQAGRDTFHKTDAVGEAGDLREFEKRV